MTRIFKAFLVKLLALGMFTAAPMEADAEYTLDRPDVETSSARYKKRFKGRTGSWFLDKQSKYLLASLEPWRGASVLDVGGGHGQYTELLHSQDYKVTVLGSSLGADEQIRSLLESGRCRYAVGDFDKLPFADKSYDVVISFRLMAHLQHWQKFLSEASRVARHAVIIDFPVMSSFNALYPAFFWLKLATEGGTTRTYKVFREEDIMTVFNRAGFVTTSRHAQYFLPMAAHRAIHAPNLSDKLEYYCETLGLTEKFGSPVILRVEPASSEAKNI